ncbi:hypothetical protein A0256_24435 [Mucilaginibacter sp. PAMC 26640]|nr:hypothetical protein A0256_24435 [Mucilaginibacter sp. PAMC 26640]
MYKEADPNPASINIVGNEWKGFASINEYVPMGNGVLFFMRGDRTLAQFGNTTGNAFVSPYPFPNATTLKFVGNIITGDVPVYLPSFKTTASYYNIKGTAVGASAGVTLNAIPFATSTSYASNAGNKNGYNLVGNPYPSTIDLEQVAFAGSGFGAAGTIGIYTLNKNNTYSLYVRAAATNTVGTANGISANNGSRYILSGQGFFVKALSTAGTITFKETAKTTYPTGTGLTGVPNVFSLSNSKPLLRVKLIQDTLYTNETLFTFGDGHANAFDEKEDIAYLGAPTQTVFLYSVADGNNPLVYNQMNTLEKITAPIKLYAEGNTTGIYKLEFTGTESIDSYYRIFLKDAFNKDSLEITANKVYTFNIDRANAATYGANRFTLVVQKSVLGAYQLVKFTGAKTADSGIKLNWETKNESDVITFNIERSTDGGKTYTDLGTIQSAGKGSYSFTDKTATIQTDLIYRLKQADVNDAILYSPLVSITAEKVTEIALNTIVVYPNPAVDKINVDVSQKVTGAIELQIVNSNGKVMKKTTYPAAQHFEQNLSGLFPSAYVINLVESGTKRNVATTKFVKL